MKMSGTSYFQGREALFILVFALLDAIARHVSSLASGRYLSFALTGILVLFILYKPAKSLNWIIIIIVLFNDISSKIYTAGSPLDNPRIANYNIHSIFLGPLALINYVFLACFAVVMFRRVIPLTLRIPRYLLWLVVPFAIRLFMGIVNLNDVQSLKYFISDVGPFLSFFVYYFFIQAAGISTYNALNASKTLFLCFQGKTLSYLVGYLVYRIQGIHGVNLIFAPDTMNVVIISATALLPFLGKERQPANRFISYISMIGAALMFFYQSGSALIMMFISAIVLAFLVLIRVKLVRAVLLGLAMSITGAYAIWNILTSRLGYFWFKLQNIIALMSGSFSAARTVEVRALEFYNIIYELQQEGFLFLILGKGAGSYFTYNKYPAPAYIYNTYGSYSADELLSGRFYLAHDFINASILKSGVIGLVAYLLFFAYTAVRMYKAAVRSSKRLDHFQLFALLFILTPTFLYSMHWGNKVSIIFGILLGLADKLIRFERGNKLSDEQGTRSQGPFLTFPSS